MSLRDGTDGGVWMTVIVLMFNSRINGIKLRWLGLRALRRSSYRKILNPNRTPFGREPALERRGMHVRINKTTRQSMNERCSLLSRLYPFLKLILKAHEEFSENVNRLEWK